MEYNLLQNRYDRYLEMFLNNVFNYEVLQQIETEFLKRKQLFTINLN